MYTPAQPIFITMESTISNASMTPLRTWTIGDENPVTISVYRPAVTIQCGDGPAVTISPAQVASLSERLDDIEMFFDSGDPDSL
jgi:hypothetical protein